MRSSGRSAIGLKLRPLAAVDTGTEDTAWVGRARGRRETCERASSRDCARSLPYTPLDASIADDSGDSAGPRAGRGCHSRSAARRSRPAEALEHAAQLPERVWTRYLAPRVSRKARLTGLTAPERKAVTALARRLHGLVVWSSNRSGNHELYLLDLRGPTVRQLTHDPHVDFFPAYHRTVVACCSSGLNGSG
jgi:hypothetical protein